MAYWLAIGPAENWEHGLTKGGVWGVGGRYQVTWDRVKPEDVLLFYAVTPVKGVIGFGTISSKERRAEPFWLGDRKGGRTLWPLRIHFKVAHCLPREKWEAGRITVSFRSLGMTAQNAFQELRAEVAHDLLRQLASGEP